MDSSPSWHHSQPSSSHSPDDYPMQPSSPLSPARSPPRSHRAPPVSQHVADWVTSTQKRSARYIAEKTCEMVCYLWFSSNLGPGAAKRRSRTRRNPHSQTNSPPYVPLSNSTTAALQFNATPHFVQFMQKLLETTQVSQSVIVLSLHYIYRLKERNDFSVGRPGSEFRVAVVALMMANKFVDDNTYTNKTWSEVSGIELTELNKMEREFLLGVDFRLFVDKATYESWLNLLKGLVMTKERESMDWLFSRRGSAAQLLPPPVQSPSRHREPPRRSRCTSIQSPALHQSQRARSSSPLPSIKNAYPFTFAVPPPAIRDIHTSPETFSRPGSKRSAAAAFSPTSASFQQLRPPKRPVSLHVDISATNSMSKGPASSNGVYTPNSMESLQSLERLSLHGPGSANSTPVKQSALPRTLAAPYSLDDGRHLAAPQNLYFYALASSPMHKEEDYCVRKSRLRYSQPPSEDFHSSTLPAVLPPLVVQSARTSPRDSHMPPVTLPRFYEWSNASPTVKTPYQPPQAHYIPPNLSSVTPHAPFANAGPPGVHFYMTPPNHLVPRSHRL